MENNLKVDIQSDIYKVMSEFIEIGFKQEDSYTLGKENIWISFSAQLLFYESDKKKDIITPWVSANCYLSGKSKKETDLKEKILIEMIDNLNIMPFRDEDAYKQMFKVESEYETEKELTCYFNPHFPNGMRCNHVL